MKNHWNLKGDTDYENIKEQAVRNYIITAVEDMHKTSAAFEKLPKSATEIKVSKCLLYIGWPPVSRFISDIIIS